MIRDAFQQLRTAISLLILLTCVTGFIYPMVVMGIAQVLFPWQANGSLIVKDDRIIGSSLIGQYVDLPNYFWGRPSATSPFPYNAANSSGSNLGPSNPLFLATVQDRITRLRSTHPDKTVRIPVDLVTSSGSGLDPEISPLAAWFQIPRIAKSRNIPEQELKQLINRFIKQRTFYILGEPRINVLELNLALDNLRNNNDR
jgi:K+-transporting ATPase ATPase C chain